MSYNSKIRQEVSPDDGLLKSLADKCRSLRVRYISTQGHFFDLHLNWLRQIFSKIEVYDFNSQETFALSIAENDYDVLFVGARDASRITKFSRINARALSSRVRFAIMDQTDPHRRAAILNAGFDDIFDLSRTVPDEAVLRIAAVWRTYQQVQERQAALINQRAAITSITASINLGKSEERLLHALCEKIGQPVSYYKLANICSKGHNPLSSTHLRVLVSSVRKKLNSSYQILSISGQGYALSKKTNESSEKIKNISELKKF